LALRASSFVFRQQSRDREVIVMTSVVDDKGLYRAAGINADSIYRSSVLAGFWLRVAWLWQNPLPPVLSVLRELGII
jgi:hypothetical protein